MREITDHQVSPADKALTLFAADEPGHGNANHRYVVTGMDLDRNPGFDGEDGEQRTRSAVVLFQNGPIGEHGVNGITNEVLLAIVADRLRGFQKGPYPSKANACALTHIEEAQHWLQQRTIERMRRGVEGTSVA